MKRNLVLVFIILLAFGVAGYLAYLLIDNFHPSCYLNMSNEESDKFDRQFNEKFVSSEYAEIKDLGKSFLSILIAVFVASITFSEKIVNYNSTSWYAKTLLILCWTFLLLSVMLTGAGMAFIGSCYNQALHVPCEDNIQLYANAFFCFALSGFVFGMGLTSMLCAGVISFLNPPASPVVVKQPLTYQLYSRRPRR